ncbi:MAG: hypothetical protein H0V82_08910 [Candidatus Protochlamydia sp.]|nr:hypothetical protein [Candidatus Protochlamydia sp.]
MSFNSNLEQKDRSFGYHCSASAGECENNLSTTHTITKVADLIRKVALVGLVNLGIVTALGLAPLSGLIIGAAGFVGASSFYYSSKYFNYKQICQTAGIVFRNAEQVKKFEVSGVSGQCEALPTEHSADTELWREDLIKEAKHNIVLSGNYCGGKSFAKLLSLLEKQMDNNSNLKVVIISSPRFIKSGNLTKIDELLLKYPANFSLIESDDIWHVSTGIKKTTNHTKCLVIDYGKYFILGGSGIKDNFAETGLDHFPKKEFQDQRKLESNLSLSLPLNKTTDPSDNNVEDGFLGRLVPLSFRDMDFVFKTQNGKNLAGKQVYQQMLLLCYRWEQYNKMIRKENFEEKFTVDNLGLFTNTADRLDPNDSVVVGLLKTPVPKWKSIKTTVPSFDQNAKKGENVAFKVFASGPEHNSSEFAKKLEKRIKSSEKNIVINHMYFHPTSAIMQALIGAAKRGVKVQIITTNVYKDGPLSHYAFGPRNKYNYSYLINSLPEEYKSNVEVYEYQQKNTGNHKKVIIVDDCVIAGSSNLGYKSLVTTSDHELNFFARSAQFADETMKICTIDMCHSEKIKDFNLTFSEYFRAAVHRLMAPLVG